MSKKFVVHGHFYQPPREHPFTGEVPVQPTAAPFHDWNERITSECYRPNVNNYKKISFNFGPTLLLWFKRNNPELIDFIVEADRISVEKKGCGNAIAQVFNHIIMPLANRRDKETQVIWGIETFEYFFKRRPLGMWLPETAVDLETLEVLAENGIVFTILSPHQAKNLKDTGWVYSCLLPNGNEIKLLFFDRPLSWEVSFGNSMDDPSGKIFVQKALETLSSSIGEFVLIATDGETFGHHHRNGARALENALDILEDKGVEIVSAECLVNEMQPHKIEIIENTSWSCEHGVERWRSGCSCGSKGRDWSTEWRLHLRKAINFLSERIDHLFEGEGAKYFYDPWRARNLYVKVLLDERFKEAFLSENLLHNAEPEKALQLLNMQKFKMYAMTSCGWFFEDISGIEARANLRFAAACMAIAREFGMDIEKEFCDILNNAVSNYGMKGDTIYFEEKMSLFKLE